MWSSRRKGVKARGREASAWRAIVRHEMAGSPTLAPCSRPGAIPPSRQGFTLIELLVVITVLAILASLVSPMIFRNVGDAKVTAVKSQVEILSLALDSYRLDNDYYPSTAQGLGALITPPAGEPAARNWRGPYLKRNVPHDPWGRPYSYRSPAYGADDFEILSLGRDGQRGGEGEDADISTAAVSARAAL